MYEWEKDFNEDILQRGRSLCLNKKVADLKKTETGYTGAVLGRRRNETALRILPSGVCRMSCDCPVARGRKNCEHMAALMYAVEADKKGAEDKQAEAALMETWRKMDEELRSEERRLAEENARKKKAAAERKRKKAEGNIREKELPQKEKAARVSAGRDEEERSAREKERREEQERAAREAAQREKEVRAARRAEREKRKAERARQKEEQKRQAEDAAKAEYEKRVLEEARREKIRQEKAEAARRRAEKKEKEQELTRLAEEKKRKEEERMRKEEERNRLEEEKQQEENRRMREQIRLAQREAEEAARQEKEKREKMYARLGGPWEEEEEGAFSEKGSSVMGDLEKYRYFDGSQIRRYMKAPQKTILEGQRLCAADKIRIKNIFTGFTNADQRRMGQMDAVGYEGKEDFPIRILFSRDAVEYCECGCKTCRKNYYTRYNTQKTDCSYKAGALKLLEEYLNSHNIGDATDIRGQALLGVFEQKRSNLIVSGTTAKKESLRLLPRLTRKEGKLSISFRLGENKLFVIKKLDEFCENVKSSATDTYGSNTEINHSPGNFTEKGRGWIRFINRIVREEMEFQQRLAKSRSYYGKVKESVGSALDLFGWRLDELYETLGNEGIEFEDKDGYEKKKGILTCAERNPRITMQISEDKIKGEKEFHGIKAEGTLPALYYGTDAAYYISDGYLNRVDKYFLEKAEPLANLASNDRFGFRVGRNHMSEFYSRVLPQLAAIADISETEPEKFRSYLLPEARFVFYLDAEQDDVNCQIFAWYGEKEFSVVEGHTKRLEVMTEAFRDQAREEEILFHAMQWLPEIDLEKKALCCGGDEDLIYRLMKNGLEKLMELGEVRCTRRFLGYRDVSHVRVSVGVSLSSGLLELDISTEDVPAAELLDILKSYRAKKKYYRLKNGGFVDLEEPSLEMLAELTKAMNLKDREVLKGKLKLPMYRTLYLDKLLEENEEVYSSRDSHFRKVVKGFKTVKDADFEEPESLSRVMRKYQKDGYKWLRTLETWQFGGILADDMGLGKTLQVIAVLLSAKEEGRKGTSLVVTPASLVFNWEEEFHKFAPGLTAVLVTGTQEERQKKIEAYQCADVLVTSYDLLKRDIGFYEDKEFSYEIIDEAQYIKNHTTAAAKAVKVIHSRIRYALTGTPIENRLSELWSIFDYLMPGFLYSYEVFRKELETPIVKNGDEKAMKRLQKMTGPFILRRLKEDVLKDLPEKLEECRYVRLGKAQQTVYDGQVLHMKEQLAGQNPEEFNKNKIQILAELTRLRQICCDPSLCFENYKGEAAKLEACLDLIQSAMDGGHRILVFSQFTSMLEILQRELDGLEIPYYTIVGSTSKEKRLELVKSFNEGETPVFLISLKAGGVGLNLTGADVVIHYDPWWNLAAQNQATDRAHRIGQKKKVSVFKLIAKNTIEEKIQKLQETKKNLADQVMGGETGGLGSMSQEELLELLEV